MTSSGGKWFLFIEKDKERFIFLLTMPKAREKLWMDLSDPVHPFWLDLELCGDMRGKKNPW